MLRSISPLPRQGEGLGVRGSVVGPNLRYWSKRHSAIAPGDRGAP